MLILAQEMFAWLHRKLPWLIVLSNLVMAKRRLEAYSLVEEADDETHLVPQSPPSALSLGAETLRFEEEQTRSGQYEAERGNTTSPVKFLSFLTSVQNCSASLEFSGKRRNEDDESSCSFYAT